MYLIIVMFCYPSLLMKMLWYESFRLCNHFIIVPLCLSLLPKYKVNVCMITWIWTLLFDAVIHEPSGPTSSSQFEHSSIPATVKKLFNLNSNFLTKRDAWAGTFEKYFNLRDSPREDCPGSHENSVMIIKWAIASLNKLFANYLSFCLHVFM